MPSWINYLADACARAQPHTRWKMAAGKEMEGRKSRKSESHESDFEIEEEPNFSDPEDFVDNVTDEGAYTGILDVKHMAVVRRPLALDYFVRQQALKLTPIKVNFYSLCCRNILGDVHQICFTIVVSFSYLIEGCFFVKHQDS